MSVVIYTMPDCVQCEATKKYLNKGNVEYSTVDISTSREAYKLVSSLGYKQAPVVVAGDMHWSGFRPDKIDIIKPTRGEDIL
jgi:glutaredoxin-like protein NrdH